MYRSTFDSWKKIKVGKRPETEEELAIWKEKERIEREERYKRSGRLPETEKERAIRKEKERIEREERFKRNGRRPETETERATYLEGKGA
jgi:hypothetical protein